MALGVHAIVARVSVPCVALLLGVALSATAQIREGAAPPAAAAKPGPDPYGRDTPRGTIAGFNLAVHRHDFVTAGQYLQLTGSQRANSEALARGLTDLLDRYYRAPIVNLSDAPEGSTNDDLPPDRERVVLTIAGKPIDLYLVRIKDPQSGLVWLIASQTLTQVPALSRSTNITWLERLMPRALLDSRLFGVPIGVWLAWAATLVGPFAVFWLLSIAFITIAHRAITHETRRALLDSWYAGLKLLVILMCTLGTHLALMPTLGFSLSFRLAYRQVALVVVVVVGGCLLWRLMALSFAHARIMAQRRGQASLRSLLLLAERVCKTLLVLTAIFALLTIAGVNTSTALAGVGLGGVAIALGAQKSVENLLGGVFLLTDRALAVGDVCSISNRVGVVEDITMRSVRLRTTERTLLSVPAGLLSQSSLENFASRDKILAQSTLRLHYGTTAQQLRRVLNEIRTLLQQHPDLDASSARIRLVDFGVRAIELELFAYVLTPDYPRFLEVRERLLLQVATIVEASGTRFAQAAILEQETAAAR
jgi:MscS family membrane protein